MHLLRRVAINLSSHMLSVYPPLPFHFLSLSFSSRPMFVPISSPSACLAPHTSPHLSEDIIEAYFSEWGGRFTTQPTVCDIPQSLPVSCVTRFIPSIYSAITSRAMPCDDMGVGSSSERIQVCKRLRFVQSLKVVRVSELTVGEGLIKILGWLDHGKCEKQSFFFLWPIIRFQLTFENH